MTVLRRSAWAVGALVALVLQLMVLRWFSPIVGVLWPVAAGTFHVAGPAPHPLENIDTVDVGPGTLLSATTLPTVDAGPGVRAARIVYRSSNGDTNTFTAVSGAVFVPAGNPPAGGWPVVAMGHGTVGIKNDCAPSLSENLDGMLTSTLWLVHHGYAVAATDYEGLGTKGIHPYLDARTAGRNMIDSVRALRHAFPGIISDRWAALGHSQGGAAAWAADEQSDIYAAELDLVGAVAMAPAADVSAMPQKAFEGRLTVDQPAALQAIVDSMSHVHPDLIRREDFSTAAGREHWDQLLACTGADLYLRGFYYNKLSPKDLAPQSQAAADQLRSLLRAWALPQRKLSAPLSVWYGGSDTFVDAGWTAAAIKAACAMGDAVSIQYEPSKGHEQFDLMAQAKWMVDRFDDVPATNDCDNHDAFPSAPTLGHVGAVGGGGR